MAIGIGRRQLICVLGRAAVAWPLAARAGKTARIGFMGKLDNPVLALGYPAFLDELKKSGFSVGENLDIEAIDQFGYPTSFRRNGQPGAVERGIVGRGRD